MQGSDHDALGVVTRKLEGLATLSDADRAALATLPFRVEHATAGTHLVREGDEVTTCSLILSGYVCRYKTTDTGARQIVSFHLAGDVVDLQHLLLSRADHHIEAITPLVHATTPVAALREVAKTRPVIADALWSDTLIDAAVFREWVLNVGRRDAKQRTAHLLCEFAMRREVAGLGAPTAGPLPITHEHIADATGLSGVHVSRMLAALAAEGALASAEGPIEIVDWDALRRIGTFDAAYLHAKAA